VNRETQNFLLLWSSMLLSTSAVFAFQIFASTHVFHYTSSGLLAGLVFSSNWILPIALAPLITAFATRFQTERMLMISELVSSSLALLAAWTFTVSPYLLVIILPVRGLVDAVAKTNRTIMLKNVVAQERLGRATGIFNTSLLLGNGLGGMICGLLPSATTPIEMGLVVFVIQLVAVMMIWKLAMSAKCPPIRTNDAFNWKNWLRGLSIIRDRGLWQPMVVLLSLSGIIQGFHNVARTSIPLSVLGMGQSGVSQLQVYVCIGLVVGAILATRLPHPLRGSKSLSVWLLVSMVCAFLPLMDIVSEQGVLVRYGVFMFIFEIAYVVAQTLLITNVAKDEIAVVSSFMGPALLASMVGGTTAFGVIIDSFGISNAVNTLVALGVTIAVTMAVRSTFGQHEAST